MKKIAVATSGRADYGIYLPLLKALAAADDFTLSLFVTGMHLSPEFGLTVKTIEEDGFAIAARIECLLSSDSPEGIGLSMGLAAQGFARAIQSNPVDLMIVLGDRFEMHAAALAALPFRLPVAHIHGGELTRGAIDDSLRHSMTKLSHLHFVTTEEYRQRVIQLGEEPWRVINCGAPSLDNLKQLRLLTSRQIKERFGFLPTPEALLVTYHPVTLEYDRTEEQLDAVLKALGKAARPLIFTLSNADTSGRLINQKIRAFVEQNKQASLVENLGTQGYFSVMQQVAAMVGNSSSGIIEAASFGLPVVNIGMRQMGRVRGANVIDTGNSETEILAGIQLAVSRDFRAAAQHVTNPYGDGNAVQSIMARLRDLDLDATLTIKLFNDLISEEKI